MDLRSCIVKELQHRPHTTRELSLSLGVPRRAVNIVMRDDPMFICDYGVPTTWSLASCSASSTRDKINTIILVDLGNAHDVVKNLEPYAECDDVIVIAFCDYSYAGYPSNMPTGWCKNVHLIRSYEPLRNAADTTLIWTCCSIINRTHNNIPVLRDSSILNRIGDGTLEFIVVTRDQGFMYLAELVSDTGHTLSFCKDWKELKGHL